MIDILVRLKNASVRTGLQQMKQDAEGFKRDVGKSISEAFSFRGITTGIATGFAALAAAITVTAAKIVDAAAAIDDVGDTYGVTADEAQRLKEMGRAAGVEMETMAKGGFKVLSAAQKALVDPAAREHFENLGLSLEKLRQIKTPEQALLAVADAAEVSSNKYLAFASIAGLLGERNAALINILRGGGNAMRESANGAARMSEETVEAIDAATLSLGKFFDSAVNSTANKAVATVKNLGQLAISYVQLFGRMSREEATRLVDKKTVEISGVQPTPPNESAAEKAKMEEEADKNAKEAEKKQKVEENRKARAAALQESIFEAEREREREKLSVEERILSLEQERAGLVALARSSPVEETRLNAEKQALEIEKQITSEREKQRRDAEQEAEKKKREAQSERERQEREEESRQERIADLRKDGEELDLQARVDGAKTDGERVEILRERRDALDDEAADAAADGDTETQLQKTNEAKRIDSQIRALERGGDKETVRPAELPVDSLQRIGGGSGGRSPVDRSLRLQERHLELTQKTVELLQRIAGKDPRKKDTTLLG